MPRALTVAAALLAVATSAAAQPDTAWSAVFRMDLDSAHAFILENHPGSLDRENPGFRRTLAAAYAEGRRTAPSVRSYSAYRVALARFGNRLQDAHLSIGGARPMTEVREAGVFPVYRQGRFVVQRVDARYGADSATLVGATVRTCDDRPASEVFRARVLSWRGRAGVEADWYQYAPLLLVDYGPPTPPAPARCRLVMPSGAERDLPLQWAAASPAELAQRTRGMQAAPTRRLGLRRLSGDRVIWVDLPTFAVNAPEDVAAMRAAIDSLRAEVERNRGWALLVLDLRDNSGGSSAWGDQIAAALFGADWAAQARSWLFDGVYTEYRASRGNIESVRQSLVQVEQRHGADSPEAQRTRALVDSLEAAVRTGRPYYGPRSQRTSLPRPAATPVPGRIVVITTPTCFSACLDFLDRMRLHPAVVQVGQVTGVDTQYMENWGRRLPSGLSTIGYPMKVYRGRRRAPNQPYQPHEAYPGALSDSAALEHWVLDRFLRGPGD
jgi:hypothetical protein